MVTFLCIWLAAISVFWVWGLHVNNKTADQRMQLLSAFSAVCRKRIADTVTPADLLEVLSINNRVWSKYDSVSYDRHMWYLLTFRDPWQLYPAELHALVTNNG